MDPDFAQRRRVFVALAITAILLPSAFLLNRGGAEADPATATTLVGTIPVAGAPAVTATPAPTTASDDPTGTNAMGTTPVGYLDGTVAPDLDDPPTIAIPRPTEVHLGEASFSRSISQVGYCFVADAPNSIRVTIKNLDNSRSVQCQVVSVAAEQPADVILHVDAFSAIADLTEAPVPVEIIW